MSVNDVSIRAGCQIKIENVNLESRHLELIEMLNDMPCQDDTTEANEEIEMLVNSFVYPELNTCVGISTREEDIGRMADTKIRADDREETSICQDESRHSGCPLNIDEALMPNIRADYQKEIENVTFEIPWNGSFDEVSQDSDEMFGNSRTKPKRRRSQRLKISTEESMPKKSKTDLNGSSRGPMNAENSTLKNVHTKTTTIISSDSEDLDNPSIENNSVLDTAVVSGDVENSIMIIEESLKHVSENAGGESSRENAGGGESARENAGGELARENAGGGESARENAGGESSRDNAGGGESARDNAGGESSRENAGGGESAREKADGKVARENAGGGESAREKADGKVAHGVKQKPRKQLVRGKSRDLPQRATSIKSSHSLSRLNSVERNKRPLSVAAEVEHSPTKMRKSNSENKKPLGHQSSSDMVKRFKGVKNGLALREIVDNSKRSVVNVEEAKKIKTTRMDASKKMLEVNPNDIQSGENKITKNVMISLPVLPRALLSALPSNIGSSYKEENSSLILKDFRVSQTLLNFYLLGRIFVPLKKLSQDTWKKATIVVLTSIYRSSFITCLVVSDKTSSVRLNMTGQAAKFWHDKLKVGQVLLLTKLGVIMEGAKIRLVQVASKDGVKVLGVAAEQELCSGLEMNLRMRERSSQSELVTVGTSPVDDHAIPSGSLANQKAKKEVLADSEDDFDEASTNEMDVDGKRNQEPSANLAAKKEVLADSDDDDVNIETNKSNIHTKKMDCKDADKKERGKFPTLLNMAAKKEVLANSEDESEDNGNNDGTTEKNERNILIKKLDCTDDDKKENDDKTLVDMALKTVRLAKSEDVIELGDHGSLIETSKNNSGQDIGVKINEAQSFAGISISTEILKDSNENKNKNVAVTQMNFDKNAEPFKRKSQVASKKDKSPQSMPPSPHIRNIIFSPPKSETSAIVPSKTPERNIEAVCGIKMLSPLPSASPLCRTDSSWNREIKIMFQEQSPRKREDAAGIERIGDGKGDEEAPSIANICTKSKVSQDELDSNNEDEENEIQTDMLSNVDVDNILMTQSPSVLTGAKATQGGDEDQSESRKINSETELTDNEVGMESELNFSSEDEGMESELSNNEFLEKSKFKGNVIEKKCKTRQSNCQNIVRNILKNISWKHIMIRNICADIVEEMVDNHIGNGASTVVNCNIGSVMTSDRKADKEVDRLCNLGKLFEKRRVPGTEVQKSAKSGKHTNKEADTANETEANSDGSSIDESDTETAHWFQQQKSSKNLVSSSHDDSDCDKTVTDSSERTGVSDVNKSDWNNEGEIGGNGHVVNSSTDSNSNSIKRKKKSKRTPHLLTFDLSESEEEENMKTTKRITSKPSYRLKKKKQSNILKQCVSSSSDMESSEKDYSNSRARKDSKRSTDKMEKSSGKFQDAESSFTAESSDPGSDEGGNIQESARPAQLDNYFADVDVSFDELDNISQSDSDQDQLSSCHPVEKREANTPQTEGPLMQNLRSDKEMKYRANDVHQQTAVTSTPSVQERNTELTTIQKTGMALMNVVSSFFQPKPNAENKPDEKAALIPLKQNPQNMKQPEDKAALTPLQQNPQNMKRPEEKATMTPLKQNPQNVKPPGKVALDELWLGRHQAVMTKKKNSPTELHNGQKEAEATGSSPVDGEQMEEDIGDDEEEQGVMETYTEYSPVYLDYGMPHPDFVVESSSLASVLPPAITRPLHLPQEVINQGKLSKVQLESVTYASQMHEVIMPNNDRAGYLIGDGAGVGKGRTIAGIILENWVCGRKRSVWISASQDLMQDAMGDLKDIGAGNIPVKGLTSIGYDKQIQGDGVIFSTFSGLVGTTSVQSKRFRKRLDQLQQWLGEDEQFEGPIVFDECHKAKNLVPPKGGKPTKTGLAVLELQNKNPLGRVVYASATGASEPKNMAYMVRLGMWGQGINFRDFKEFSNALEKRGTGGLEQVALDLKLRGSYIARQLSFKGVDFGIEEVPLSQEFIAVYDTSVEVWRKLQTLVYDLCERYPPTEGRGDTRKRNFWGFMQKFFKYLAISSKISYVVGLAKKELRNGNCVVIGLQSTGEAATVADMADKTKETDKADELMDALDDSDSEEGSVVEKTNQFSSASSKVIKSVVTRLMPCQHKEVGVFCDPAKCAEKKEVWEEVVAVASRLPTSSLDQLIEELGGPKEVAELTGRKKRLEKGSDGVYSYVNRVTNSGSKKDVNLNEKRLFMAGKKKVAIISEAGSTGISLQADKRVKNQRRRVHFTIELPWSADSAIQQFGRTHRSNQSSAPKYVFVISALHGEKRFASIVAKRLESLGALTHGDRRSTRTSDLSTFNFHTDHATYALKNLVLAITGDDSIPMPSQPKEWKNRHEFYNWLGDRMEESGIYATQNVRDNEQYPTMTKFMNRLLCVKVNDQNVIFSYFTAILDRVIAQAKKEGRYDSGIMDVVGQEKASKVEQHSFEVKHATGLTTTMVTKFDVTRGMSFEEAVERSKELQHKTEGFWLSVREGQKLAVLVIAVPDAGPYKYWKYLIYRPNTGKVFATMPYENLRKKYQKVTPDVARKAWNKQYDLSLNFCYHAFKSKNHTCKIIREGGECEEGRRKRNYHVISGSLLSVWPQIEEALGSCTVRKERKIKMVRINNEEERIIGINIPNEVAGDLINSLKALDLTGQNAGMEDAQMKDIPEK